MVAPVFAPGGAGALAAPAAVLAAGDIAHCGEAGPKETAALLDGLRGTVLALGDLAYNNGTAREFRDCYDPTWGRYKARTRPAPGNHEYGTRDAAGYYGYWGARAGPRGRGYYSFDLGAWHLIALNSSIDARAGSPQDTWLAADLAASRARCVLAFWHHPVFSSGRHGNIERMRPLFRRLYEAGASIVLGGHDHLYERFAPLDPEGRPDPARGIREFVVGTGGARRYRFGSIQPGSEFRDRDHWGVLRLELGATDYGWRFIGTDGRALDAGRGDCAPRAGGAQ